MNDVEKLKQIIRETRVQPEKATEALAKIRAVLDAPADVVDSPPVAPKRVEKAAPDRMEKGATTRDAK